MLDFPKQKIVVAGAGRYSKLLLSLLAEDFHCYVTNSFLAFFLTQ